MNLYRVETRMPLCKEPFVDFYLAPSEAEAIAEAKRESVNFGLPSETTHSARLATSAEVAAFVSQN